ncbi:GNAT family N-acetyltransferase [Deinococcus sp.]|uniref:GNAT family N-acetyltransferase n=1 Tax=Deinococcus sp. TaxID=47478 RepID=UPI003C7B2C7E
MRVHFRPVTPANLGECLALESADHQRGWVASNTRSLAQAYVNPALHPHAVYAQESLGFEQPVTPVVGFVVLEVAAGTGFLLRLMIGEAFQGQGLGRAALREAVRRLRLDPDVQLIASSHVKENAAMAGLLTSEGFMPWDIEFAAGHPTESFLRLPD